MPQVVWSRFLLGERPEFLLGQDRILLHRTVAGVAEMTCFDFAGGERWSQSGWSVLARPIPRQPLLVDSDGDILHRCQFRAQRHDDTLLFADKEFAT